MHSSRTDGTDLRDKWLGSSSLIHLKIWQISDVTVPKEVALSRSQCEINYLDCKLFFI